MATEPEMTSRVLLVTDVVDSTQLSEKLGDVGMAALWARHDRAARDLLRVHGGREIDKTDGFLMLFDRAADAVAYAVAYHAALRELGIAARTGIHAGPVILTENAAKDVALGAKPLEVDGLAKPTAARVMSVATGGQTLLTRAAMDALGPTSLRVAAHGRWRMKGVSEPLELFEVGDEHAPMAPPPDGAKVYRVVERDKVWLPARDVRHTLPAERDAFVGRGGDLRTLADLVAGSRLVSVLGIGGTGKTRLVTHFAWTWLGDFPGGVWFCDVSEARDAAGIAYAVATALEVPLGKDDPMLTLGHAIAGRGECLVVLDNFEQVARYAAETVGRWLDRARDARFVVTTREVLGLPGESAFVLAPLAVADSVALFIARARQSKRDFVADDEASIRALVALLDHLPLAIELAAARARVMPPKTMLLRMGERFRLLSSTGARHTRQATLQATFDWGWDLLSSDERSALAQLSVFEGGFTLDSSEGVLELAEQWPLDAVQALVDRSWVRAVSADRFDLLLSVQEYAAEKLRASGGAEAAERRHGAWFAQLGTPEALAALDVHGGVERFRALRAEMDNTTFACRRAATRGDADVALPTFLATANVLMFTGVQAELAPLADAVLALEVPDRDRASLLRWRGWAEQSIGRLGDARATFEEALAYARAAGDRHVEASTLGNLAGIDVSLGRMEEALALQAVAVAIARDLEDRRILAHILGNMGVSNILAGRREAAVAHYEEALALYREAGNRRLEGLILGNLAGAYGGRWRPDLADELARQALAIHEEVGNRRFAGEVLSNLGALQATQGRDAEARVTYERALTIHRELGNRRSEGLVTRNLGLLAMHAGRRDEALALMTRSRELLHEVSMRLGEGAALRVIAGLLATLGRADEAVQAMEAALAIHRETQSPFELGMTLGHAGSLFLDRDPARARALFEESLAILRGPPARPAVVDAWRGLARLAFAEGSDTWRSLADEAVAAVVEQPDWHVGSLVLRGNLRLAAGDVAGARADADAARAHGPRELAGAEAALLDARTCHAESRPEAALQALADALAFGISPQDRPFAAQVAMVRAELGVAG